MRPFDELARLWNDTRSRLPRGAWSRAVWIWPLVAAVGGALLVLMGTSASERRAEANDNSAAATVVPAGCEEQTWPYFTDECLRRNQASGARAEAQASQNANQVRVLQYEPALAAAAIAATPWAPKDHGKGKPPASRQTPSRHKQATHDQDHTATARSSRRGRNAAREPTYGAPPDAFSAYGSARRYERRRGAPNP